MQISIMCLPLPRQFQIYWLFINHFQCVGCKMTVFQLEHFPHICYSALMYSRTLEFLFDSAACNPPLSFWCSNYPCFGWWKPLQPVSQGFVSWSYHSEHFHIFWHNKLHHAHFVLSSPRIYHFSSEFPFLIVGNVNENSDLSCWVYLLLGSFGD